MIDSNEGIISRACDKSMERSRFQHNVKHKEVNKIVVVKCAEHYVKCWRCRNECVHDEDKQRKRLREWYGNVKSRIVTKKMTQLKMHVRKSKINLKQSVTDKIKRWTWNVNEIEQTMENFLENDIRRHFKCNYCKLHGLGS